MNERNRVRQQRQYCIICSNVRWLMGASLLALLMMGGCAGNNQAIREKGQSVGMLNGELKPALQETPDAREMLSNFDSAMALIKAEKYDEGIEQLKKTIEVEKKNPVPYINLAIAYCKVGNMTLAEENIRLALEVDPGNPVANNEYAILYRKTGRFSEARHLYESTLEKYPNYFLVHKNLGILCDIYMRDYECALKHYEAYGKAMPDDKAVQIWIDDIQRRLVQ